MVIFSAYSISRKAEAVLWKWGCGEDNRADNAWDYDLPVGWSYLYGGYCYKLPSLAGAAESCIYENGSEDRIVQIPYESIMDDWYMELLKLL